METPSAERMTIKGDEDMDYIKLTDGTQITIEDGASLDRIIHISDAEADATAVCKAVTAENIARVEFYNEGAEQPYGVYDDLTLNAPPTRHDENGAVVVTISLREKTDLEKRMDALEQSQETQDGAIEDLGQALSDMAEA